VALRILHAPDAVGGNPGALARAERKLGLRSWAVALEPSPFGYEVDEVVRTPGQARLAHEVARFRLLARALRDFDVVHFNFGRSLFPPPAFSPDAARLYRAYAAVLGMRDLPLLRRAGKGIVVTFQGDDVRRGDLLRQRFDESLATRLPQAYSAFGDAAKARVAARFDRYADAIFYLNPDLAYALPSRAEFVPYAGVDPREWRSQEPPRNEVPLVLHAPSDRAVKGTEHVLTAVDELRREGRAFEFQLVEGIPHDEVRSHVERADVFVDQLHAGWYGVAAVELMALGKPVVSNLRADDFGVLPAEMRSELPVVGATVETLADVLRELLSDDERRRRLGRAGRAYVERWHDPNRIAERLADTYERAVADAGRAHQSG
jgi:glycosyltransferase involved in cell wall biosynthesis